MTPPDDRDISEADRLGDRMIGFVRLVERSLSDPRFHAELRALPAPERQAFEDALAEAHATLGNLIYVSDRRAFKTT